MWLLMYKGDMRIIRDPLIPILESTRTVYALLPQLLSMNRPPCTA
jgi:hypothetical protein